MTWRSVKAGWKLARCHDRMDRPDREVIVVLVPVDLDNASVATAHRAGTLAYAKAYTTCMKRVPPECEVDVSPVNPNSPFGV